MVKENKPKLVYVTKTKAQQHYLELLKNKIGFECLFGVGSIGRRGGVALLWKEVEDMEIQNYASKHINVVGNITKIGFSSKLTGFYGHPVATKRLES